MINLIKKITYCLINPQFLFSYIHFVSPLFEAKDLFKKIKNIKKINTLIDVGSNKGQFILIFSKYNSKARIHSFEPQVDELLIQKKILRKFRIKFYNFALGNKLMKKNFFITKRKDSSSFLKVNDNNSNIYKIINKQKVSIKTLDKVFKKKSFTQPALLKIDVQGFEKQVLIGSSNILKKIKYIIIEVSSGELYKNQETFKKINNYLIKKNFKIIHKSKANKIQNFNIIQKDILYLNRNDV